MRAVGNERGGMAARTLLVFLVLVVACFPGNTKADTVMVLYDAGITNETTELTGYGTTGAMMAGMDVIAIFDDGSSEGAVWATSGPSAGRADGTNWSLAENGDTFGGNWVLSNDTEKCIMHILIDAGPGDTVFDTRALGDVYGTLGSARGWDFTVVSSLSGLDIVATYVDEVALTGDDPVGDLFRWLEIEFVNEEGFCNGRTLKFIADTDNIKFAGDLNQSPVANPNGPYLGAAGSAITFDGTNSHDPDGDPLTYDWDFGDGSTNGTGAMPNHAYSAAGIYDVCLTVTDSGGLSDTACTYAVVYDPSAGFVTGGGWIWSDPGNYRPNTTLEGKAVFGFVSKYKKGASVPTGQTEFQFHAGDLNFHSSSYQWLVVTGSNYAKFKGSGTINGIGNYKFMLWAGDGPDTFRIKIWREDDDDTEHVVYDNGMDQLIGGGNIVVHAK